MSGSCLPSAVQTLDWFPVSTNRDCSFKTNDDWLWWFDHMIIMCFHFAGLIWALMTVATVFVTHSVSVNMSTYYTTLISAIQRKKCGTNLFFLSFFSTSASKKVGDISSLSSFLFPKSSQQLSTNHSYIFPSGIYTKSQFNFNLCCCKTYSDIISKCTGVILKTQQLVS